MSCLFSNFAGQVILHMQLYITSLNSGSNGNCYYIGNSKEAVLIDAGISCRETEKRMKRLGLSMNRVKALFVSHEHSDHIKGIAGLCKKYQFPIYITDRTRERGRLLIPDFQVSSFRPYEPVVIGDLLVTAFPKYHDATDPHSFIVRHKDLRVGVFTDIGRPCDHVISQFRQCDAAFLEANYDEDMLENSSYPYFLKQRIRGGMGHLSNRQAVELFQAHRSPKLTHLFLSHLSENNNCPGKVQRLFSECAGSTRIVVASRYEETAVYVLGRELPVEMVGGGTVEQLQFF